MALALGFLDIDKMLDRITPEMLDEWMEYYELEPFGEPWRAAAMIAAEATNAGAAVCNQIVAAHGGTPPHKRPVQTDDYLKPVRQLPSPDDFEKVAQGLWQR